MADKNCDLCCNPDKPSTGIRLWGGTHSVQLCDVVTGRVYFSFRLCSDCEGKFASSVKSSMAEFVNGLKQWEFTLGSLVMTEVTLTGGPMDGDTVEVEAGQLEVEKDGCKYKHQEATGFYCYVEGESKTLRRPSRTRLGVSEK